MHLDKLQIPHFRNLKDFEITFTDKVNEKDILGNDINFKSHAVIGANGSGKSNLLEAIVIIFRDLDLNNDAAFDYKIDYSVRNHIINVTALKGKKPDVRVDGTAITSKRLSDDAREYLPSNVFVYYSGENKRIEQLFQAHQKRFNQRMEVTGEEYLPAELLINFTGGIEQANAIEEHKDRIDRRRNKLGEDQLRRLFYCRPGHSQLVLLACLLSQDKAFIRLMNDLNILELESALFVLKQPYRLRRLNEKDIQEGDNRFWYARGEVVSEFLDKLWDLAVAPIEDTVTKQIDFRGRSEKQDQLYLFLPDKERLEALSNSVGDEERFFRYAEAAYNADLIEEVRIKVKHKDTLGNISFSNLSEGELQLLTVLGLMRITTQDHCLFLLDEPDTHLNPIWKLRYFDEIEKVLHRDASQIVAGNSQIIATTHDPMMIGGLRKEQVRILRKEKGLSSVDMPNEHPQGMGVAGLLKSEMFGLRSTLDAPTLRQLHERNELIAKKANSSLSEAEENKLVRLRNYLDDLGFSHEDRDPLYQLFIQKMYEARNQPISMLLSAEQLIKQEELAEKIVKELIERESADELSVLAKELKIKLSL